MKKAIVTGICSFIIALMAFFVPVCAEEYNLSENETLEKTLDEEMDSEGGGETDGIIPEGDEPKEDDPEEPTIENLLVLYEEKKLVVDYTTSFVYTGNEIKPEIVLYLMNENEEGENVKTEFDSENYIVEYKNNVNVNKKAEIIVRAADGNEKYCGEFTVYFAITPKSLGSAKYKVSYASANYNGKALTPAVTVELNGKKLKNKQDYSVAYRNNKEVGTATVTVAGKGNYSGSKKITFKIVLATPKLSAETGYNKITVKWGKVSGATKYVLERSTSKTSGFKKIAEIKNGSTVKCVDQKVTFNKTYYYRIRAYRNSAKSSYSAVISQKVKPATAKISKVSRASYNSLKVTWKKVSGASGYVVYRSTSEKGTYKKIATVNSAKKLTYTDKKRSCGVTYFYKVAAYRTSKGKKYFGSKSACVSARTTPAKISFTTSSSSDDTKVTLYWKKSSGATGYTIYRSVKKDSGYTEIKDITKAETVKWKNTGLDKKQVYYYKIRPYVVRSGKKIYGSYSAVFKKALVSEKEKALKKYTNVAYRWGGTTPKGWDCSGFTQWAMKYLYGIDIARNSAGQAAGGKSVSKSNRSKWQFGDILVYSSGGRINHVALYIGNNKIMHALNSKYDTIIQDVDYYENWDEKNNLKCVRRYR